MSPRPYRLGQREAAVNENRTRILDAARELLAADGGPARLTVDAVARQAGVARMTVYYQFGSKAGLLEALFDDTAHRGGLVSLPESFARADPWEALDGVIRTFCRFWATEGTVLRRIAAAAALDRELNSALQARNRMRQQAMEVLAGRITGTAEAGAVDVLTALTSLQSYDVLAQSRSAEEVASLLSRSARALLLRTDAGAN